MGTTTAEMHSLRTHPNGPTLISMDTGTTSLDLEPDSCILSAGNSTQDRFGCPDTDGDGWSDGGDAFPADPSEVLDTDSDGIGDNADSDDDNDGVDDVADEFPLGSN